MVHLLKKVPSEKIPKLLQTLENKLPYSIVVYHWIKTQLEWASNNPSHKVGIYTLNGGWADGNVICVGDGILGSNKIYGAIYTSAEMENAFKEAVKSSDLIEWNRIKRFVSVLKRDIPVLREILDHKGCKFSSDLNECYLQYLSAEEGADVDLPDLPRNVRVGPLEEQHSQIVCDNWRHFNPDYRSIVTNAITFGPTIGVFVKNELGQEELASMVMRTEYGAIGLLQTVPEHRMKGYAKIALAHITKQLAKRGFRPFGSALTWNETSLRLFDKLGYHKLDCTTYFMLIAPQD